MLFVACSWGIAQANDVKRIAVLPFTVHSKTNAQYLDARVTAVLVARLERTKIIRIITRDTFLNLIEQKRVNNDVALKVGETLGADYVIYGSLTQFGNSLSADLVALDVKNRTVFPGMYAQSAGPGSINAIARDLADKLLMTVLKEQTIESMEIRGSHKIEDSAIFNVIKSEKGQIFSERVLSDDIKAIYKMGYFDDVRVEVSDGTTGKRLTFIVEEKPVISSVEVKGNDEIDRDEIDGVINIKPKQIFSGEKVKQSVENIRGLYRDKGYLDAAVSDSLETLQNGTVRVVFTIEEHKKLYVEKIIFEGNKAFTDDDLKDMMEISESGFFTFLTDSGLLKMETLKEDIKKINAFYNNNGYINARVGEPRITHDEEGIYVTIPVTEGQQFRVGKVEIQGDVLSTPHNVLMQKLKITQKDYFDREAIMRDIDYLSEVCNNDGYAYANVIPRTTTRDKDEKIDVVYNIEKGHKVYFNRITISGNTKTRDKVIRRKIQIVEGDLYSREKLKNSYMSLSQLRYFEEVNFKPVKGAEEHLTDINIEVREKPTGLFSIGAGYSAEDKAVFMAQISQQNLFGKGQILSVNAYLGSSTNRYEISFTEPWLFDRPLWSKFDLWNMDRDYDSYDLNTKGFKMTFGHHLFERVKGYIGYQYKMNDVNNVSDDAALTIKDQEGETTTSGMTVTLSRDTTNDWMFPSRGSKNSVSVEHTGTIFQGDTSFTKYTARSAWFLPLPLNNVFSVRGRIGYLQGNEGKKLPIYERFVLGGMNSLRGLRDVGPTDPDTGDVIGGTTMLSFTAEVVFPLFEEAGIKGVVFYDTGNAWESGYHLDDMRQTAGAGIRWYSPIGPLRLEWGYVLDREEDESPSRWEFTIGMFM